MIKAYNSKYNYLLEQNNKYMDMIALSFEGKKITYEEMHDKINKYANLFKKEGIKSGDIVGVCVLNTPESVYILYSLDVLGAVVVGLSPFDNMGMTRRDIELTNPEFIITIDAFAKKFYDLKVDYKYELFVYSSRCLTLTNDLITESYSTNVKNIDKLIEGINLYPLVEGIYNPGQCTDIMFTGGSTGVHKGVDLDGSGLNFVVESSRSSYDFYPGMIYLGNIPIGHMCFGKAVMHMSLCNNLEFALTLKAMPTDFYEEIVRTRSNCAAGGPPHWMSFISKNENGYIVNPKIKKDSLTFLKYAGSGGEILKKDVDVAINNALKYAGSTTSIGNGYGATEAWSCMILNSGTKNSHGTLGNKMDCLDFKIVDPKTFEEVEKGESGLLLVSGKSIMIGYHNDIEETSKVLKTDSCGIKWYNTGDIVRELPNGEYTYIGRIKRNFVCGVTNIYPEVLESLLIEIPNIREVVVTKVSDDEKQFIPKLTISLFDININEQILTSKIRSLIETRLTSDWLPDNDVRFITYIGQPLKRTANNKIDIAYYQKQTDLQFFKDDNAN